MIKALSHFSIPAVIELQRLKTKEFTFGASKKCGINLEEMKNRECRKLGDLQAYKDALREVELKY